MTLQRGVLVTLAVNKILWTLQLTLPCKLQLHRDSCQPFLMQWTLLSWCYPRMTVEEGCIAFQLNFRATFTHTFTCTLATAWLDVLFIVHIGDSAFTTAKIGSYTLFLPSLQSNDIIMHSRFIYKLYLVIRSFGECLLLQCFIRYQLDFMTVILWHRCLVVWVLVFSETGNRESELGAQSSF